MYTLTRALSVSLAVLLLSGCPNEDPTFNDGRNNVAPRIVSDAPTTATEDLLWQYQVDVEDPDDRGRSLYYALATAPAEMTISRSGLISWTPANGVTSANVHVVVVDGGENGAKPAHQSFVISVTPVNDAPQITSVPPQSINSGAAYVYRLTVDDPDDANNGSALTYQLLNAPAGMTMSSTGLVRWVATAVNPSVDVEVQVSDGGEDGAAPDSQSWTINVVASNTAPLITSSAVTTATEAVPYSYQLTVVDAEDANNGADLNFSLLNAPVGMTVSSTGLIEWTPPENGAAPWIAAVEVQVADGGEDGVGPDSQSFNINVTPVNNAPTITSVAPTSGTDSVLYSYQLAVTDSDDANNGTDLSFSLPTAPAGMTISTTGLIEWTPSGVTTADVQVQVADGGEDGAAAATQTWTISIDSTNDAPTITSTPITDAVEDLVYQYQLTVVDSDDANNGTDLSFSFITSPAGMTVSSTGLIEWTPTENGATPWTADVEVQVADGGEDGAAPDTQSFTIDVTPVNDAPVFVESSPLDVAMSEDGAPTAFALTLNVTDIDSATDEINWSISSAASNGTASASGIGYSKAISYTPAANFFGTDSFIVQADDGDLSATLTVNVTISAVNDAPTITSVAPTAATEAALYQYAVQVTDVDDANDGTGLTFSLLTAPAGMTVSSTGLIQWTPPNGVTSADVTVEVADGGENGVTPASQSWTITVADVNEAPVITEGASIGVSMSEDSSPTPFALTLNATDADAGAPLTWTLNSAASNGVATASASGNSVVVGYTPNANYAGSDSFVVEVSDGLLSDTITVNVTINAINDQPVITSAALTSATEDTAYQYSVIATDVDGPSANWSLTTAPAGMTISAGGVIDWTPGEGGAAPWTADVVAQISDGVLADTQSFTINVAPVNDAPTITSAASTSATEAALYSYQLVISDSDDSNNGTDIGFSLTTAPAGMTVSSTGLIQWTPPNGVTSADVTVEAADGGENGAAAATQSWTINVGGVNQAPTISSTAVTAATESSLYSYQLAVSDSDDANNGTDLSFSLITSPAGMTVSTTGLIEWTPAENGATPWTADVEVQVADGGENGAAPDSQSFTINVTPVNNAPTIDQGDGVAVNMSEDGTPTAFATTISASDADTATGSLSWSLGGAASNGAATASGTGASPTVTYTPNANYVGADSFIVSVSDGEFTDSITVNVTISAENDAPVITSSAVTAATEDALYQYTATSTDADGPSATWDLISGPAGMSVSAVGLVQWMPGEGGAAPWTANVSLQVSDGSLTDTQNFTINVTPVNDAPTITSVAPTSATEANLYSYQLVINDSDDANNGTDIGFSLTTSPAGMSVSATGLIEWTPPNGVTSADVTVEAADGGENGAAAATQSWTITVGDINDAPTITSSAITVATESTPYSYQLTVNDPDDTNNGTDLSFSLLTSPTGMTVSTTGLIEWTPTENGATPWTADVEVQVADGGENGAAPDSQSFTINVTPVNNAPTIDQGDSVAVNMSEDAAPTAFAVTLSASDADTAAGGLSWSLGGAASNGTATASGTGASPTVTYTPTTNYVGSDSFIVSVSDGEFSDSITVNVTVSAENDAPVISSSAVTTATEDALYQYDVDVTDIDGPAPTFSLTTFPAGMSIDPASGLISWTPGEGGASPWTADVIVSVTDGSLTDTQSFTINVTPVNDAPSITSSASTSATEAALYSYQLLISDSDDSNNGTDIGFTLTTAPAGMTVSATGLIQWTPPNGVTSADVTVEAADGGENGAAAATQSWTITVGDINDAPTITSTAVTAATESSVYSYQLTVNDPDDANNGTDLTYSLITSPAGMTVSATGLIQWTPAENGATPWTADVEVQVADGGENGAAPDSQNFTINVAPVNNAPIIDQGDSVAVNMSEDGAPTAFAVTISATDPDTAVGGLTWSLGGAATNGTATASGTGAAPAVTYTPTANYVGSDSFIVSVSDGEFTDSITVNVTISAENDAPVISSTAITTATEDAFYQYDVNITDPDGAAPTFSLTTSPAGMSIDPVTGVISWTPGEGGAAIWPANVTVDVTDGSLGDSQSFTINVTPVNDAPTITSSASTSATEASPYSYQLVISDADDSNNGTDIAFSLTTAPAGMTVSATGLIEWTPPNGVTSADVTVEVTDGGENGAAAATQSWTITVGATNDAPTITSVAPTTATEAVLYGYQVVVSDADDNNNGTDLTFSLITAPTGMTISTTGLIQWTPAENGASPWTADVEVQVADGGENGAAPDSQNFTINVTPVNNAPTIDQGDSVAVIMSEDGAPTAFTVAISASDADTAAGSLTWSLGGAASNGTATASGTGAAPAVTYTPNANYVGSDSFVVSVSDGEFTDSITVNVTINAENDAPVISSAAITTATEDALYQYDVDVADSDGPSATFSLTTSPAGMTIDSASGVISWTPGEGGAAIWPANVTVDVTDGSLGDSQSFTINVTPVNDAPTVTSIAPTSATEGNPYSYQVVVSDSDDSNNGADIAFNLTTAPAGMTVSSTGLIEWTPPNGATSENVVLEVTDGGEDGAAAATQSWTITIGATNDAPTITSSAITTATEGSLYSYQLTVNDPDDSNNGTDLSFSLITSPAGMNVSTTGLITWTPAENGASPWTADVEVQVADGGENGAAPDSQSFTINVTPVNNAPTIDQGDSVAVNMSEDGAPTAFAVAISASDADTAAGGLTWSLTGSASNGVANASGSGAAPTVSYTPSLNYVGSDSFIVSVSDGEFTDSITVNVTVSAENDAPVISSSAVTAATEDALYQYNISVIDSDGPAPTFSLTTSPAGMSIDPASGVVTWTPGEGGASPWTADVVVAVTDGSLGDSQSFTINVAPVNDSPTITSSASTSATEASLYSYQLVISDSDDSNNGTDITFNLTTAPAGMTVSSTGLIEWTPANGVTSANVVVEAADGGENGAAAAMQSWTITVGGVNDAPMITSSAVTTATEDALYSYQLSVDDPDDANNGTDLTYSLITSPAGMSVSSTGLITWTPGEGGASPWTADVEVQVADGGENGAAPDSQSFTINVTPVNNAPTIDQGDSVAVIMSEDGAPTAFAVTISASDADTAAGSLTWSLGGAATNGTATASGAGAAPTVTYTPNANYVGADSFIVSVSDGEFTDSITVNVTVNAENDAPVISSAAITTATEDALYQYDVDVTDLDGPAPTFSLSVSPAGMTINPASGVISWTPGEGGAAIWPANVTVDVTDGSLGDSQSFTINVTPVNDAPTITSSASTSATEASPYSYQLVISDSDDSNNGTDIAFSLTTAPAGMTVSSTGLIEWTPPNGVTSADVTVEAADGGENGAAAATQSFTITVGGVNDAPTITSTAVTAATEASLYSYQLAVTDPDDTNNGTDLSFSLITSPAGMSVSSTGLITWTPGEGGASPWTADVEVEVADGGENGAAPDSQSFTINVTPVNNAPTIDQGDSVAVIMSEDGAPTAFTAAISASDADTAAGSLTWSLGGAASNGTATASGTGAAPTVTYTPNANYVGSDSFVVSVSDGEFTDSIAVNVTINAENDAPVISSAAITTATEDALYQYDANVTDSDGPSATWTLTTAPAGMGIDAGTGVISWTPGENGTAPWSANVTVQVSDGSLTDSQSFSIDVTPVNDAPLISSSPSSSATEGDLYSYQLVVADPDDSNNGTDIGFSLTTAPAGMTVSATGLIEWTPPNGVSSADVTVEVADGGENGVAAATQSWTITVGATNDAPTISSVAPTTATEDVLYSYQLVIADADDTNNGTDISFNLTSAPAGMTVSALGLIEWTPPNGVTSADVSVEAADGGEDGAAAATQSWTITVTGANDAPEITEGASIGATMSEDGVPTAFALTLNATDIDGDTLTWSISSAATNGSANVSGTGLSKAISYAPNADFNGSDSFVVSVSDGTVSDTITVNVTVESVNDAPSITSSAITTATEAALYQYQATSSDVDGPSAIWSLTTAPAGMTVSATGLVQWTPQENGATPWTADVVLQISDGTDTDTQSFTINVTPENNAPVITEGASVNVNMSEDSDPTAFALTLNATDSDSSTLTWSISSAASNGTATATGTGLSKAIGYTPNANYSGSDSFVVTVSDGALSDTITVNVTIAAQNDAPVISSSAVTTATEDSAYSYDVDVTDSDGPSATFSLTVSPAGMTIDPASGVISWTPGEGGAAIWNESVTVEVTDGTDTDTQSFSIAVTPVNDAPSIDSAAPTSAVEGVLYQYTLSVSDSDDTNNGTDLSFSLTTAPAGMTISPTGVIAWTPPNGVTSADVTARVVDGGENGAAAATQSWIITVGATNDAPTITSTAITTATEDAAYSYQLTVNDPDDANNGTDLAFSLTTSPAGMSVSNTGLIAWTPGEGGASLWTADVTVQVADGGENGALPDTQSFTINVTPVNDAPEVDQGASVAVNMSEDSTPTAFSVSISATDADTAAGSLTWSLGSAASNGTATATGTGASPTVTYTPNANYAGSDSFVVSVSDGEFSDSITVNVTVAAQNDAPQITSSAITTATEDVLYQYSATSSDIDGPLATWSLTTAPAGMTVSAGGLVQWTPGENGSAAWTADVVLQISDGTLTDTQSFTVNVTPVNDAPSITSVAPTTATEDTLYSYQLVISDADDSNNGTDIGFSLTTAPAGMTVSATGLIEWTPANGVTSANVVVEAADGGENGAAAATQNWTINVTAVNDAPSITSVAPTSATEDVLYSYQLVISDADDSNNGTDISFNLTTAPAGMTVSATGLIEWTPANGVTSADVVVEAADGGENGAAAATQSWTITVTAVNDAPVITEGASVGVTMSEDGVPTAFSLTLNATDIEGDTLFWSIQTAAANGTANATGSGNTKAISYTPTANFNGSDSFVVRVSDGVLFDDITVNVTINAVNDAPVISTSAVTTATEGSPYSYDVNATDAENDTLTFSLTTAPSGMSINPSTGVISWTPGEGGATPWNANVTVQVTDGSTPTTQSFVISVTPVNDAPVITEGASVGVTMSENSAPTPFSLTLNATDIDSTTLTWSIVTPASNGAAMASGTGGSKAISYTPNLDYAGSDSFVVRVSDGALSDDITVNVTIEQVNTPPSISSTPITEGYEGIPYQYDVDASDAEGATLTYSLTTSPTGMTINSSTGVIDWLPGDNGGTNDWDADVVVSVTDGTDTVTQSFTVNVEVDRAVHGRAVKGVLANALVEVSLYDSGTDTWSVLATTTTNAAGVWGFDLPTQSVPVRVRVTSTVSSLMTCDAALGCGAAVFGDTFAPEVDIIMDTIVPGSQFSGPIAVTPLTTMAAQWVDDMPGGVNDDVILLAMRRVADLFGLGENFAYSRAIDITRPIEVSTAVAGDISLVRHALFAAALQEVAASQTLGISSVNSGIAQMFSLLGGQMLLQTGVIDLTEYGLDPTDPTVEYNGLDLLVSSAQAVAAQVNVGGALDALSASLDTLVSRWNGRVLSALGEGTGYDAANFARALAPLDEFDYYYNLAEAAEAGINEVNRSVGWMYIDEAAQTDTTGMANTFTEALGFGLEAAMCVPGLRQFISIDCDDPGQLNDPNQSYTAVVEHKSGCSLFGGCAIDHYDLELTGSRNGQTVNLIVHDVRDGRYLLGGTGNGGSGYPNDDGITVCFNGTISNSTAVMTLSNFCINPNLSNNDTSEFEAMSATDYTNAATFDPAFERLLADIYIYIRTYGDIDITSTDASIGTYSMQNFDANFTFNRRQITQPANPCVDVRPGYPCSMITVNGITLNRTNPAGETLSSITGTDMFNLVLDDTSTLHIANDSHDLGLPVLRSITDVTITGLEPLNDVISEYLLSMIDTTVPEPVVDWDQLQLDLEGAVPSGTSTMQIFDTTNKLYTFTLNADGSVDVSQVNSLANAMTVDLKGVAGYIYADETLVSTGHLGNDEDGLLLSLVNDTQRSYVNANPSSTSQIDGLVALLQQLFPPAPEPAP